MQNHVEKLNFSVDLPQLRKYYETLQQEYSDYIWSVKGLAEKDEYTATRVAEITAGQLQQKCLMKL